MVREDLEGRDVRQLDENASAALARVVRYNMKMLVRGQIVCRDKSGVRAALRGHCGLGANAVAELYPSEEHMLTASFSLLFSFSSSLPLPSPPSRFSLARTLWVSCSFINPALTQHCHAFLQPSFLSRSLSPEFSLSRTRAFSMHGIIHA